MNNSVLTAVFKRNFFSYFANPTGYVFICVFVFLSAIAAFWPDDFFNANLANLDQLNKFFPFIMLFFVPTLTMSIWAEETRQGTDELLLTIPATDFDIVLGKYLAAVSIYTVALAISMVSNYLVLSQLGSPDKGLYVCTHLGYWLMGLAMLAIGMVASFLTRNLTVAYVLGALFNAPLVFMGRVDIIPGLTHTAAASIRQWSLGGQCQEFGRGILSLSGIIYFLSIAAIMLYVCMVLIGRRNWARGDNTSAQSGHFLVRAVALGVISVALVFAIQNHDVRSDATSEQLSSLSPYTINLVKDLKTDYVEATKLQPEIAKLEDVVKTQEAAQKKAAAEKAAVASPGEAKPKPAAASGDSKPMAAAKSSGDAKAADVQPAAAKGSQAVAAASPTEKKPDEKKAETKATDAKVVDAPPPSDEAKKLAALRETFDKLKVQGPVRIDAFISTEVPESYVQTRLNLLADLREFKALGGNMVELEINDMGHADPLAEVAKTRFNILPKEVIDNRGGTYKRSDIFLGVAFTCGLEKVILPFVERGLSAEYELVRSLCTVTRQKRMRIGVLETDAHVFGNFTQMGMSPAWQLIEELKKQYEVVQVNPADLAASQKPGEAAKRYDVLLAIQPSAMGPQELDSFVSAVRAGQPTVIFEDPFFFPYWVRGVPGTYQPRTPQSPMMGMGRENQEKGDIRALWRLLGIDFSDGGEGEEFNPMAGQPPSRGNEKVVWQRYNPFPKLGDIIEPEFVFIDPGCGAKEPFSDKDPISSKLQHLFFPGPGFIEDTPEVVKRLIAKWHNHQYAKQLEQEMRKLSAEFDDAKTQRDNEKINDVANRWSEVEEEFNQVNSGGDGRKTIRADQIGNEEPLKSLVKDLGGGGDTFAVSELRRDLANRFPVRVLGTGAADDESARLADEEPDRLRAEAAKLKGEAGKADTVKLMETIAGLKEELSQVLTVADAIHYAQGVVALQIKDRKFVPLVQTASEAVGTVPVGQLSNPMEGLDGRREALSPIRSLFYQPSDNQPYVLAAHIQGATTGGARPINVVLVADVEMVSDIFFSWREQGSIPGQEINFDFDNVTFALNALDSLAGDDRYLELRKRRPMHRTLTGFDARAAEALKESAKARKEKSKEHDEQIRQAIQEEQAKLKELKLQAEKQNLDPQDVLRKLAIESRNLSRKLEDQKAESHQKYNEETRKINDAQEAKILGMQGAYKLWAVVIPPIPLLVVAGFVFFVRRAKEREGVSSKRLR